MGSRSEGKARTARAWLLVALASGAALFSIALGSACGVDTSGLQPASDGSLGEEADVVDAGRPEAPGDDDASDGDAPTEAACLQCNGQCIAASDCRGCDAGSLLCAPMSACVGDCSKCVGADAGALPIECFACDNTYANPLGTCASDDRTGCLGGNRTRAYVDGGPGRPCFCLDGGVCPGSTQVCAHINTAYECLTCGETTGSTADAACSGGGVCNASTHECH